MCLTLEVIWWQKDGGTQRKQWKICSFGRGILCCFTITAVPGTRAYLDCRSRKTRRWRPCVGLLICSLILSRSSPEAQTSIVTRSSLLIHDRASGALCVKRWRRQGWVRRDAVSAQWGTQAVPLSEFWRGRLHSRLGISGDQVMNEGNYRLWESVLQLWITESSLILLLSADRSLSVK